VKGTEDRFHTKLDLLKILDINLDMDLLAKKIHYTILNTIIKLEIILAQKKVLHVR
jgi:hypothetical protein